MNRRWTIVCMVLAIAVLLNTARVEADETMKNPTIQPPEAQNSIYKILDQILSWYFVNLNIDDLTVYGKPKLVPGIVGNSLLFNGNDSYAVIKSSKSSDTLSNVELSAWILPNYTNAPREMSIIEKDGAFSLQLKKYGTDYRAEFSVFNGIRWSSLYTNSTIQEKWTDVDAMYDGNSMKIYLNGRMDAQIRLQEIPLYYIHGIPVNMSTTIRSDADIYIGASGTNLGIHKLYKGMLDEVQFYLTPSKILQEVSSNVTNQATNKAQKQNSKENTGSVMQGGLSFNQVSNATVPSNATLPSNGTQGRLLFNQVSNATFVPPPLPRATESYQFKPTTILNETSVGKTELATVENQTSLSLTGEGYLYENGTTTKEISNLTVSAWVKPDFSRGSSEFTVLGKERMFALSINNVYPPPHLAKFSVFDGIKWHTVESKHKISENWTHLAATFNGTSIAIYVNGTEENAANVGKIPSFNVRGQPTMVNVGNITSSADVVIGAYQSFRGNTPEVRNLFSGQISTASIYTKLLDQSQIGELYNSSTLIHPSMNAPTTTSNPNYENFTGIPITPLITKTEAGYLINEKPEFNFEFFSNSNLQKFGKSIKESKSTAQQDGWKDKNTTISVRVLNPSGKEISTESKVSKLRAGKFDVQLDSLRSGRAGMYKIVIDTTIDGKSYSSEQQFEWGLVSLNTDKSIYLPGETGNFTIIVLDNEGHSVCNSNIRMNILDPSGRPTTFSSGNGISKGSECGIYNAQYTTSGAGNYTISISATNPSGTATFDTSFSVRDSYAFDIIRTAQSKIDPVTNPNLFNVKIDVQSHVAAEPIRIREFVPSVFNVTTDANVQTSGVTKILTWDRSLVGNKTSVQYSYSVPLQYPQLYALGPVHITYGNGQNFTEARPWFVAVDPVHIEGITSAQVSTAGKYLNFSVTVPAINNKQVLVVGVGVSQNTAGVDNISNIIWGDTLGSGTNCQSNQQQFTDSGADSQDTFNKKTLSEIWHLPSPQNGTHNICIVGSTISIKAMAAGAFIISGIDTSNPVDLVKTASAQPPKNIAFTLDANSNAGDIVIDNIFVGNNQGVTFTSGQTAFWTQTATGGDKMGGGGSALNSTGTSTSFTWTENNNQVYAWSAVAFKRAPISISLSENLGLSDALSKTRKVQTALVESLPLSDTVVYSSSNVRTLSETLPINDSMHGTISVTRTLGESMPVSDSLVTTYSITRALNESMPVSDSIGTTFSITKAVNESLPVSDSLVTTYSITRALNESLPVSDSLVTTYSITRALNESLPVSDSMGTTFSITKAVNESLPVSDAIYASHVTTGSLNDTIAIADTVSTQKTSAPPSAKPQAPIISGSGLTSVPIQGTVVSSTSISSSAAPTGITMKIPAEAHLTLYQVSYDVCGSDLARILVGTTSDIPPKINVITGDKLSIGKVSAIQPFDQYQNITGQHLTIYEAPLQPSTNTMTVTAINPIAGGLEYVQNKIAITSCSNTVFLNELPQMPSPSAPTVLSVTAQVDNETRKSSESAQYTDTKNISVYAMIGSNTTLQDAQLRFVDGGQNLTRFTIVNMTLHQVQGSQIAYIANGTIPRKDLSSSYATYWVWTRNNLGLVGNSQQFLIGVKPTYKINATVSAEIKSAVVQGKNIAPTIYVVNNSTGPIYGSLSLVANGTSVSNSPGEVFEPGVSATSLSWTVPRTFQNSSYTLSARAEFYNTTTDTYNSTILAFPSSKVVTLSRFGPIEPIHDNMGNNIGEPIAVYSSFENQNGDAFKVVSPDGTCVIGQESSCLLSTSAVGNNSFRLENGQQNYTVEYAGTSSTMQWFSISSSEPIIGPWKVGIEKAGIPQQDMMSKVILKVTYSDMYNPFKELASR